MRSLPIPLGPLWRHSRFCSGASYESRALSVRWLSLVTIFAVCTYTPDRCSRETSPRLRQRLVGPVNLGLTRDQTANLQEKVGVPPLSGR